MIYVPTDFIKEVDQLPFTFLWGEGKCLKVKRSVVTNYISLGGLKMVDFKNTIKSLKWCSGMKYSPGQRHNRCDPDRSPVLMVSM